MSREEREHAARMRERFTAAKRTCDRVMRLVGPRYAGCTLESFEMSDDPEAADRQSIVLETLNGYREGFLKHYRAGHGIVFFGPPGTGKDHLMVAMLRLAGGNGLTTNWTDGMTLFGRFRDAMDSGESEASLINSFADAEVLGISDPIPPWGDLTQFQAATLFRLIDRRYRDCKPTFVTANFADGPDAAKRIGSQAIDRLKDGAITLHCNWPSYRRSGQAHDTNGAAKDSKSAAIAEKSGT